MSDTSLIMAIRRAKDACADLKLADRTDALLIAGLLVASAARDEAVATPGGFNQEQARQVTLLKGFVELIKNATPDAELDRLSWASYFALTDEQMRYLMDDLTEDRADGQLRKTR